MTTMSKGPRTFLKTLRALMVEPLEPQRRLDCIVEAIARNMEAEVCSLYILRADGILELYATQGLNPASVHTVQLRLGQGLVGNIAASARVLNLTQAQKHPAFTYLPETGEEIYSSFLGVPVVRIGRTLGVLVVQNKSERKYRDDEAEALETAAMVIAEMIATGDLDNISRSGTQLDLRRPVSLSGQSFNDGIGLGHVVLHEPRVVVTNMIADNQETESKRLQEALGSLRISIDDMLSRNEVAFEGEHRAVLEAYRMFAHDQSWVRRMEEAIGNGLTAEASVEKVQNDMRLRVMRVTDPFMRERMNDFDDLANRLLRTLLGHNAEQTAANLPKDSIIIARTMGAAELLDYPRENLRGLALEDGSITSHVVIIARAMGIPVAGQIKGVVSMAENGDAVIIDGEEGAVHLRPQADVESAFVEKVRFRTKRQAHYRTQRGKPSVSQDGVHVALMMNAGLTVDMPQLDEADAAGIGLFRSELHFMVAAAFPRAEEQERFYRQVFKGAGDKPVTFRTLDIGGDKILPYFASSTVEENPALGWRAIRLTLDRPVIFRTQIRALLKAAGGRELKLMLPMITQVEEISTARDLIDRELNYLQKFSYEMPTSIKLGAMIEVPSLLWQLPELMAKVDFVSVGSNDLFQFIMAADRTNARVFGRFDPLSIPFLRILRQIIDAGITHDTPVTLCGELSGRPLSAMALIGLGYRSLSMAATAIGPVKAMLADLNVAELKEKLDEALDKDASTDTRALLIDYARDHNIAL